MEESLSKPKNSKKKNVSSFSDWKKEVDRSIASSSSKRSFIPYGSSLEEKTSCNKCETPENLPMGVLRRKHIGKVEIPEKFYVLHGITALTRYTNELYQNEDDTFSVSHFVVRMKGEYEKLPLKEAKKEMAKELKKTLIWRLSRQKRHEGHFFSCFFSYCVGEKGDLHCHVFLSFDNSKFKSGWVFQEMMNDSKSISCCSALIERKVYNLDKVTKSEFIKWASYAVKYEGQDKIGFGERNFGQFFPVNPKEFALRRSQFGQSVAWRKGCPSKFDVEVLLERKRKAESSGKPFSLPSFVFEGLPLLVASASRGSLGAREVLSFVLAAFPELSSLPCVCAPSRGFSAVSCGRSVVGSVSGWVELLFREFFGLSGLGSGEVAVAPSG